MPGVGKTALAAELARRHKRLNQTFWHSFHANEGVSVLIWKLAGFLAWHGQRELWNNVARFNADGQPSPSRCGLD